METVVVCKNIYPDISDKVQEQILEFTKRFRIDINFLFEDGISFSYQPEDYRTTRSFGDLSFLDPCRNIILMSVIESFGKILICDDTRKNIYLEIPIMENNDYDL